MGIRHIPESRIYGQSGETLVLPLEWGRMYDDAENPLSGSTLPIVPAYDTAVDVDFDCDTQTNDGTKTDIWWTIIVLPTTYVDATSPTVNIDGKYTLGGDAVLVTSTIDVEAFPYDSTNGDYSNTDICATAAQDLATSIATETFTLTGTSLTDGTSILIRFTSVIQITSAGGAGTGMNSFNFARVEYTGKE